MNAARAKWVACYTYRELIDGRAHTAPLASIFEGEESLTLDQLYAKVGTMPSKMCMGTPSFGLTDELNQSLIDTFWNKIVTTVDVEGAAEDSITSQQVKKLYLYLYLCLYLSIIVVLWQHHSTIKAMKPPSLNCLYSCVYVVYLQYCIECNLLCVLFYFTMFYFTYHVLFYFIIFIWLHTYSILSSFVLSSYLILSYFILLSYLILSYFILFRLI